MQVSKSFKRLIFLELSIPVALLTLGIYHGLMQTIFRAGVLQQPAFAKIEYYQGLTLHGVINAIVLTTFFAVAFGHATMAFYFKKEPNKRWAWISFACMMSGTVLAAWAMLAGKASVLYTFYPPLKAHPFFLPGSCFVDRRVLASVVYLGQNVCPMEKAKSDYKNTFGGVRNPDQFYYLVRMHSCCCV